ncbi:hypothetical protein F862_gp087 [Vibrio phage vB_VpaS_MAR10]|uniref:Uncharacterized protein n=1 Tax=Vibrio phage vB_VpaS_MAR10 TaxID=1229755 RepID=K7R2K5_9CAUD|nr:hypothetical protein F862_gp087 [Vibrio phage vB_VpaS_MAR10]AFV81319.1 hypothetical protein MAR10_084A [Vibrio phage vB_VpaS_MAR10]
MPRHIQPKCLGGLCLGVLVKYPDTGISVIGPQSPPRTAFSRIYTVLVITPKPEKTSK